MDAESLLIHLSTPKPQTEDEQVLSLPSIPTITKLLLRSSGVRGR